MKLFVSKLHYKKKLGIAELVLYPLLLLLSYGYSLIIKVRNYLYDNDCIKSFKSQAYVISVGNLTTGGVGKTPVTAEIANYYSAKGKKTAIILRGYGAKLQNKEPNIISDGKNFFYDSALAGDEAVFLAKNCPNSAVITCKSRVKAAQKAIKKLNSEVLILDDAFQHRKIQRDLNLLLIDNKNQFGNGQILPLGPLREPLSQVKRADKIILVNKSYDDEKAIKYCSELEKQFKKKVYLCKMIPDTIYNIKTNEVLDKNAEIIAFCAIGQPKEFYEFLKKDYTLAATVDFEDHHSYDKSNIKELIEIANKEGVKNLVTTEKDAVKIKDIFDDGYQTDINIFALKLKAYLDVEEICNA